MGCPPDHQGEGAGGNHLQHPSLRLVELLQVRNADACNPIDMVERRPRQDYAHVRPLLYIEVKEKLRLIDRSKLLGRVTTRS